ncbi:hypothetical protein A54_134 [Septuagintavirus sv54]|uniref:Lipoprotein n=1 Tax=Escherichia phage A5-4 TaxID=2996162 RepID=A0AAE9PRQ7_9CAUD|nr:hypothetical protein [Escherichia phage UPEC06]UZZ64374.1 hypothetical protein A54_134 [Escherichia phage A5-4]
MNTKFLKRVIAIWAGSVVVGAACVAADLKMIEAIIVAVPAGFLIGTAAARYIK